MLVVDFSKGSAIHRLYGHETFVHEAKQQNKGVSFIRSVCNHVKCTGYRITWRNRL